MKHRIDRIYPVILAAVTTMASCATSPKVADHSEFKLDKNADQTAIAIVDSQMTTGLAPYKFGQKQFNSQWIKCSANKSRSTVLVMHRFGAGFEPSSFCKGWVAQVFVKKGFQVVAVNRPSYVGSTGVEDLSGLQSLAAIKAGLDASGAASQLVGIWGYDVGTIAAAFFAKQTPSIQWLILGGGIYDLEITERSTESAALKTAIASIKTQEGEAALERRSIAWDFNDLTKTISIYHAKEDKFAPESQESSFNSQLRTSEFKVFDNHIEGAPHDIPWRDHMNIVDAAINQVAPAESRK